jgi:hypothetical protein
LQSFLKFSGEFFWLEQTKQHRYLVPVVWLKILKFPLKELGVNFKYLYLRFFLVHLLSRLSFLCFFYSTARLLLSLTKSSSHLGCSILSRRGCSFKPLEFIKLHNC